MLTGQILLQLIIILFVIQIFGYVCQRLGQLRVIGEIIAGLILGPSLLGAIWPGLQHQIFSISSLPTLQTLGDIGLLLYMFSLGSRLDIQRIHHQSRQAIIVSLSGILLPLISGFILGYFLFPGLAGSTAKESAFILLLGIAMSITAFPVLARLLAEKKLLTTDIGILALTCASIDDVLAWCLLAIFIAVVHEQGVSSLILVFGSTIVFVGIMFFAVKPLLNYLAKRFNSPTAFLILSLWFLFVSAYITNAIGIHPIFGAFLAGIILPRHAIFGDQTYSIDKINNIVFLPLYFVSTGLKTQIGLIRSPALWLICLLIIAIACLGKILGVTLSSLLCGETKRNAFTLGALMNTRGLVELVVLSIGLDEGVLSPTLFAMLVIMAIVTTMMASPLLALLGYRQKSNPSLQLAEQAMVNASNLNTPDIS